MASRQSIESQSIPPHLVIYQMAVGHYVSHALALAAKMRIADCLKDGPRHYREIASRIGADPLSLNRVMRLLASAGIFKEEEGGHFSLTPIGELLRSDVPGSMRAPAILFAGQRVQEAWNELEFCVNTGQPAFRKFSPAAADAFAIFAGDPEGAAIFDEAMASFTGQMAIAVARAYDFSKFGKIVDVGGGNGALAIEILKANPALKGIVFDRPASAARAKEKIAEAGLESRCEAVGGDFFERVPEGADAYLLKHIIHDWNDDDAAAILRSCRRAADRSGAKLLVVEGIYPPRIDQSMESRGAAFNDVNMLVVTGGRQRSETEFRSLYESAGFRLTKIVPTGDRVCVIEGEPR